MIGNLLHQSIKASRYGRNTVIKLMKRTVKAMTVIIIIQTILKMTRIKYMGIYLKIINA